MLPAVRFTRRFVIRAQQSGRRFLCLKTSSKNTSLTLLQRTAARIDHKTPTFIRDLVNIAIGGYLGFEAGRCFSKETRQEITPEVNITLTDRLKEEYTLSSAYFLLAKESVWEHPSLLKAIFGENLEKIHSKECVEVLRRLIDAYGRQGDKTAGYHFLKIIDKAGNLGLDIPPLAKFTSETVKKILIPFFRENKNTTFSPKAAGFLACFFLKRDLRSPFIAELYELKNCYTIGASLFKKENEIFLRFALTQILHTPWKRWSLKKDFVARILLAIPPAQREEYGEILQGSSDRETAKIGILYLCAIKSDWKGPEAWEVAGKLGMMQPSPLGHS